MDCRATAVLKYKKILIVLTRHISRCESPRLAPSPPGAILSRGVAAFISDIDFDSILFGIRDISNLPFLFACFCYFPLS